jgi:hypothetical protein
MLLCLDSTLLMWLNLTVLADHCATHFNIPSVAIPRNTQAGSYLPAVLLPVPPQQPGLAHHLTSSLTASWSPEWLPPKPIPTVNDETSLLVPSTCSGTPPCPFSHCQLTFNRFAIQVGLITHPVSTCSGSVMCTTLLPSHHQCHHPVTPSYMVSILYCTPPHTMPFFPVLSIPLSSL